MLEKPSYQVVKTVRAGRFKAEIRHYEPYLIAESTVTEKTMRDGTSKGFMNVARYRCFTPNDYQFLAQKGIACSGGAGWGSSPDRRSAAVCAYKWRNGEG